MATNKLHNNVRLWLPNKFVFGLRRNTVNDEADVMSSGRQFHSCGPAEAKWSYADCDKTRRTDRQTVGWKFTTKLHVVFKSRSHTRTHCCLVSDSTRRSLRSADVLTCVLPRTLSSYGDRTFAAAGPRLWNSLPVQLRNPDITYELRTVQTSAEGTPFTGSMNAALCDFWYAAP